MKQKALSILNDLSVMALVRDLFAPGTPLALVGAQLLYFSEPLLAGITDSTDVERWAQLLEGIEDPLQN